MKTLISILTLASLFFITNSHAANKLSASNALALCKTEAKAKHPDYKRSKTKQVKPTRAGYKVRLKILLEEGSVDSICQVGRDGSVVYALN